MNVSLQPFERYDKNCQNLAVKDIRLSFDIDNVPINSKISYFKFQPKRRNLVLMKRNQQLPKINRLNLKLEPNQFHQKPGAATPVRHSIMVMPSSEEDERLKSANKNLKSTYIMNSLHHIVNESCNKMTKGRSVHEKKHIITEPSESTNEFMDFDAFTPKNKNYKNKMKPKIRQNEITKLVNQDNIVRRKIYSCQRVQQLQPDSSPFQLTFYNNNAIYKPQTNQSQQLLENQFLIQIKH